MKFAIGQHICHPLYGPGQIVDIDEQIVESRSQEYHVIRILGQNSLFSGMLNNLHAACIGVDNCCNGVCEGIDI